LKPHRKRRVEQLEGRHNAYASSGWRRRADAIQALLKHHPRYPHIAPRTLEELADDQAAINQVVEEYAQVRGNPQRMIDKINDPELRVICQVFIDETAS
jgi:hypothetical protein